MLYLPECENEKLVENRFLIKHESKIKVTFHEKNLIQSQKQSKVKNTLTSAEVIIFSWNWGHFSFVYVFIVKCRHQKFSPYFQNSKIGFPLRKHFYEVYGLMYRNVSVLQNPNKHVMIDRAFSSINAVAAVVEAFYRVVKPFIKGSVSQILGIKHSTAKSSFSFRM